jgi:hypothetical protein
MVWDDTINLDLEKQKDGCMALGKYALYTIAVVKRFSTQRDIKYTNFVRCI